MSERFRAKKEVIPAELNRQFRVFYGHLPSRLDFYRDIPPYALTPEEHKAVHKTVREFKVIHPFSDSDEITDFVYKTRRDTRYATVRKQREYSEHLKALKEKMEGDFLSNSYISPFMRGIAINRYENDYIEGIDKSIPADKDPFWSIVFDLEARHTNGIFHEKRGPIVERNLYFSMIASLSKDDLGASWLQTWRDKYSDFHNQSIGIPRQPRRK